MSDTRDRVFSGAFPLEGWPWQVQEVAGKGGEGRGWGGPDPRLERPSWGRVTCGKRVEWSRALIPGGQRQLRLWSRRWPRKQGE